MKWAYIIEQKIKAALALGIILIIILVTNVIDKNHFTELKNSFHSVYEDRLLVESYIYELSEQFHKKKGLADGRNTLHENTLSADRELNTSIAHLFTAYGKTELTPLESVLFDDLTRTFEQLCALEMRLKNAIAPGEQRKLQTDVEAQYRKLSVLLNQLSEIQLAETRKIIENSNRIIAAGGVTSRLEMGIIIVIGLIVQVLIFTSHSLQPKFPQNSALN